MKVPIYEPKVAEQAPVVSDPNVTKGVPGMTGEAEAQALTKLGQAGEKVGLSLIEHIQRQNYWKAQEQGMALGNKFNEAVMNMLYDNNMSTRQMPDGTEIQVPNGYLLREGHLAEDAAIEYRTNIDQLKASFLSQVKDPVIMRTFAARAEEIDRTGYNAVVRHQAGQWRSAAVKSIDTFTGEEIKRYAIADEEGRLKIYAGVHERINEAYKSGILNEEQYRKKKQSFEEQLFYATVDIDPQTALNELSRPDGIYQNIDEKKRRTLGIQASQAIERRRQELIKMKMLAIDSNERNVIKLREEGKLTPLMVSEMIEKGEIRKEGFGNELLKGFYVTHKLLDDNKRSKLFNDSVYDLVFMYSKLREEKDVEFLTEQEDFRTKLTVAETLGELNKEEIRILNAINNSLFDDTSAHLKSFDSIRVWTRDNSILQPEHRANIIQNYMAYVDSGINPEEAVEKAKREYVLTQFPQAKNNGDKGIAVMDISGVLRLITPEGIITTISEGIAQGIRKGFKRNNE